MKRLAMSLMLTLALPVPTHATDAFVLTSTICDNQYDAMNYIWYQQNMGQTAYTVFYFDGQSFHDLTTPNQPADFSTFTNVFISAHGGKGTIAGIPGAAFATYFLAAHPNAPTRVEFMTCFSARQPGPGLLSVLGRLAAVYPATQGPGTAIGTLSGFTLACALRRPDGGPAATIGQAVRRQAVVRSSAGEDIIATLLAGWQNDPYQGTTYKSYCENVQTGTNYSLYLPFMNAVNQHFGAAYLNLINDIDDGMPYTCGATTNRQTCQ